MLDEFTEGNLHVKEMFDDFFKGYTNIWYSCSHLIKRLNKISKNTENVLSDSLRTWLKKEKL